MLKYKHDLLKDKNKLRNHKTLRKTLKSKQTCHLLIVPHNHNQSVQKLLASNIKYK